MPLRREVFDASDKQVSDDAFVTVRIGSITGRPAAAAESTAPGSAWVTVSSPASLLTSLAGQGWELPATLSGGLPLYAASWSGAGIGQVTDLEYSDGLNVISLFVQRGILAPSMPGWRPMSLDSRRVYVSGHSVTWQGHGLVLHDDRRRAAGDGGDGGCRAAGQRPAGAGRPAQARADRLAHLVDPFG